MQITREAPLKYSLEPSNHPYLSGAWTPVHEEVSVAELEVIEGEVPADIDGIYLCRVEILLFLVFWCHPHSAFLLAIQ